VFVAALGDAARDAALGLVRDLRRAGLNAQMEYEGRSLKSQMKRADRLQAPLVFLLGDDELARDEVSVKHMARSTQESVKRDEAVAFCRAQRDSRQGGTVPTPEVRSLKPEA
jgi:histidyl-tRNA synthetase